MEARGCQRQRSRRGSLLMRACSRGSGLTNSSSGGGPGGSSGDLSTASELSALSMSSRASGSLGDLFNDGAGVGPVPADATAVGEGGSPPHVAVEGDKDSPLHPALWFRAFDNERLCDHMSGM